MCVSVTKYGENGYIIRAKRHLQVNFAHLRIQLQKKPYAQKKGLAINLATLDKY